MSRSVKIADIKIVDEANGRALLLRDRVVALAEHLAHEPLLHPITLRDNNGVLELVAGRHRLAAFEYLGRTDIEAVIITTTEQQAAMLRLAENVSRSQLSPVEEAKQLAHLVEADADGVEGVALALGRPVNWILDRLEMMAWPADLLDHVHAKRISLAAAKTLVRIGPPELRAQRVADAANHGCSAATARLWLQHAGADNPHAAAPPIFSCQEPQIQYKTETRVICFGCQELRKVEETQLLRWCVNCLQQIQPPEQPQAEMSPMLTPPVYDPPPPERASPNPSNVERR